MKQLTLLTRQRIQICIFCTIIIMHYFDVMLMFGIKFEHQQRNEKKAIIHNYCSVQDTLITNNNTLNSSISSIIGCKYESNDTLIPNNNTLIADISFIIATRNDGYGRNPLQRLRFTLQQIISYPWFKKYDIIIEIIIVEWNTYYKYTNIYNEHWIKSLIDNMINSSSNNNYRNYSKLWIKFISVPEEIAKTANLDGFDCSVYEYWAKNVGLRRSSGKWKLIMNIDDIFTIQLLNWISNNIQKQLLDTNGIYTACPRRDINFIYSFSEYFASNYFGAIPLYGEECNIIIDSNGCINHNIEYINDYQCNVEISKRDISYVGDFQLFHFNVLYKYYGGGHLEIPLSFNIDSEFLYRMIYINNLTGYILPCSCSYCHFPHDKNKNNNNNNNNNNKTLNKTCNQISNGYFKQLDFMKTDHILPYNIDFHHKVTTINIKQYYQRNHQNWGFKGLNFDSYICSI